MGFGPPMAMHPPLHLPLSPVQQLLKCGDRDHPTVTPDHLGLQTAPPLSRIILSRSLVWSLSRTLTVSLVCLTRSDCKRLPSFSSSCLRPVRFSFLSEVMKMKDLDGQRTGWWGVSVSF